MTDKKKTTKVIPLAPVIEAPKDEKMYDKKTIPVRVIGSMDYMIDFIENGTYTARYGMDPKEQIIAFMITRDTFQFLLDADSKRKDKKDKLHWNEKQRITGTLQQLEKYMAELSGYIYGKQLNEDKKHRMADLSSGVLLGADGQPLKK